MMVLRDGKSMQAERENLIAEGVGAGDIRQMQPRAKWYKPDGTPVWPEGQDGPADDYHIARFRAKGWTLAPPAVIAENKAAIEAAKYPFIAPVSEPDTEEETE